MQLPRDYVGHMAKQVLKRLAATGLIQFEQPDYVNEVVLQVVLDEMTLEDRINEEVRKILEQYGDKMKQFGATYEEAFKVIKKQLVHDRKVIL